MRTNPQPTLRDIMAELKKLTEELANTRREVKRLRRVIHNGEQDVYPWEDLPKPRRNQVVRVFDYLKEHPDRGVHALPTATEKTFVKVRGGYPNPKACYAYCHAIDIEAYI